MSAEVPIGGDRPAAPLAPGPEVAASEAFGRLLVRLRRATGVAAGNLWGSSQALVLSELVRAEGSSWFCVLSSESEAESFAADLAAFGTRCLLLPAREKGRRGSDADYDSVRRRLQAAQLLAGPAERHPPVVVASLLSALQPVPSPGDLEGDFLHLQLHQRLDTDALLERTVGAGYSRVPLAEGPGEISLRGDILDLFPFSADRPLRLELFDDEIESIRSFDPETQLSVEKHDRVSVCIAADAGGVEDGDGTAPLRLLPASTGVVRVEPLRIDEQAEGLRIRSSSHANALAELATDCGGRRSLSLQSLPGQDVNFGVRSVQSLSVGVHAAPEELAKRAGAGDRVSVLCRTEAEAERFARLLEAEPDAGIEVAVGSVARGFHFPGWVVVNHRELTGVLGVRGAVHSKRSHKSRALRSFFELRKGDYVVHAVHGLARFVGLERVARGGGEEEHLHLMFAEEVSLFVPASRVDLVQRYIGSGSSAPTLDKLGAPAFRRRKERVERALQDLSAELLEVQAKRELVKRPPWPRDDDLVRAFIGEFPHTETEDQLSVDGEIRDDLCGPRPMDRLVCGDVGFGKTELALRAAFRVANAGSQVAVLVPTTVLADQHYRTFRERFADFPVEVGTLSRYVKGKRARETAEAVAEGRIDVLVGTHRMLSKDVRFKKLGLIVIDEEQRFGVTHKEHFKRLRANTDVLTLSATPIPRTLHMSLSGVRDISALTVPPPGRQAIDTVIVTGDPRETVREALLREKQRGGQVFFLHNRVQSIERVAAELRELVPECSFAVGHGQMAGSVLARVMETFIRGDVDVLVATTIVENGIDIPSAGTIVIDRADTFGLSELHQLRGRVGRGGHQAHCYLLVDETKPLKEVAKERLKALEELNELGAGFGISMKDLEIRGAGNILGAEQSGHIASVGYDMYCRLLKKTIDRMQSGEHLRAVGEESALASREEVEPGDVELELGLRAFLPEDWIPSENTRLDCLRELDAIRTDADADGAREKLRDRFGRLPAEAERLVRQFRLRALLAEAGIRRLAWRDHTYLIEYSDRVRLEGAFSSRGAALPELRPLRAGQGHLVVPPGLAPEEALDWLEGLLRGAPAGTKMSPAR